MSAELFQPTLEASTDVAGNITFTLPPPTGSGLAVQCTVSILATGSAGEFHIEINKGVRFGSWSGSAPFGAITYQANQVVRVLGSGLNPNTVYQCQVIGIVDEIDNLGDAILTPTGTTQVFGSKSFLDVGNITLGQLTCVTYRWFPCNAWGSMRLAGRCERGGPIVITCNWFNGALTRAMGTREYLIGDGANPCVIGAKVEVDLPHLGDMLEITVCNNTGGS